MGTCLRRCVVVALLTSFAIAPLLLAQTLEYQVKAAFLLNFTKFVEWPPQPDPSTMNVCILGDDPFGATIDQLVKGESVAGNRIQVQRVHRPVPDSCRVLYIGRGEKETAEALEDVGSGVLTVGEGADFLRDGGIIAFVIDNHHVRFDINQRAAAKAQLMLSAKLLSVAREVIR